MKGARVYWRVSLLRREDHTWGYRVRRTWVALLDGEYWYRHEKSQRFGFPCARDAMIAACRSVFRDSTL